MSSSLFQNITHAGGAASHQIQGRVPITPFTQRPRARAHGVSGLGAFGALGAVELGFESLGANGAAFAHKLQGKAAPHPATRPMPRGVRRVRAVQPGHFISH